MVVRSVSGVASMGEAGGGQFPAEKILRARTV